MLNIALLVCFIMVIFLWLLVLLGAVGGFTVGWLPFFGVLILGIVVFFNARMKMQQQS